jgi:outer membrane immunogenic protein
MKENPMRIQIQIALVLLFAVALPGATNLHPQTARGAWPTNPAKPEIAADFTFVNSNAPVGGCGCFGLYGGGLTLAFPIAHGPVALVGDASTGQNTSITANNYHLTLSTFTAGARYTPDLRIARFHPFAQAMAGVAHASQDLVKGSNASVPNAAATFALDAGGGVDLDLSRSFRLRLAQASYSMTTFDNGSNNRQNNLRLSAGLVFRY